ncbi:zinc ABC transporter substrate-binding protein [Ectothiorhodospiraceae bacterium 2226]|nr:zinc ABC transporter substrate-binding protein [Ectothiorhodospiraceae bacterium 2226]
MSRWMIGLAALAASGLAQALEVVATTPHMGMLARVVGGEAVNVTVLAPPDRDVHYLQARPSMMRALRSADLVIAVGADLEVGWLPAALEGAANPGVLPGRPGYFEAAAQVELLQEDVPADRAHGDVHPAGNPHLYLDPVRMAEVAEALAGRLARLGGGEAAAFTERAHAFTTEVEQRLPAWQEKVAGASGAILFHKDADYLLRRLDVPALGYVEPLPGIPPTAAHLRELVRQHQGEQGVVIRSNHQPARGPEFVARQLDWPLHALPHEPPLDADMQAYFALIERWVDALAEAR